MPAQPAPGQSVYDTSPATSGRFRHQFRALEEVLATPRVRGRQIVANARERTGKRRRSHPVEWFDTEAGRWTARLLPAADGDQHVTLAPPTTNGWPSKYASCSTTSCAEALAGFLLAPGS